MIKSYLLIAFRHLTRHHLFSAINILGLSVGLSAAIVLFLFARYQLGYDQFHSNQENIYIVYKDRITPTGTQHTYDTWYPLLAQLRSEFPEVTNGTRISEGDVIVEVNGKRFSEPCYYSDENYFHVFDFPLSYGENENPLPGQQSAVISERLAEKYFGDADAIGKTLILNFDQQYTVTGVMKAYPQNASIASELIVPIASEPSYAESENDWGNSSIFSIVQLRPDANPSLLSAKFPDLVRKLWNEEVQQRTKLRLLPLRATFETFIGDPKDVYILLFVGLGLVLIVTINFVNLSTARSLDRAKEVSMRKVFGAGRNQLVHQFMYESIILSLVSLICSFLMVRLLLPFLNQQFELDLALPLTDVNTILALLATSITLGVLAGSVPSFSLSGLKIQRGLKTFQGKGVTMRNTLVAVQFAISIVLVVCVIVIGDQIKFMKRADMGFDVHNQLVLPISPFDFADADEAVQRLQTFKDVLSKHSAVKSISSSRHIPFNWTGSNLFVKPEGWQGDPLRMRFTYHDADFFPTYQIPTIEGPGFKDDSFGDQRESAVINEAAMRAFGWNSISDKKLMFGDHLVNVVGLIRDFNYESLQQEIEPIIHFHRSATNRVHRFITVKVTEGNRDEVVEFAKSKWAMLDATGELPFNYFFLNETVDRTYQAEDRLFTMIRIFAMMVLVVACIGLFGLSTFTVEKRKKEIGIRKVLGASVRGIVVMFYQRYIKLILISFLIATPVSVYLMNEWLSGFARHTSLTMTAFILSFFVITAFTIITVSFKSIQVAMRNPANVIREDS